MTGVRWRAVSFLTSACAVADGFLYRPFVVRATPFLPRWWNCRLARLSLHLDERWGTGFWEGESAPAAPGGPCSACGLRPSPFVLDVVDEDRYADTAGIVRLCGWCRIEAPVLTERNLSGRLSATRRRSVSWRWG